MVYIDDILIVGETTSRVVDRLRKANLKLKLKKCRFAKREVGYQVSEQGLATNPGKVETV